MYNGQQTLDAQKLAADQAYREQQAALEKALAEAGLTGMYNGQQTLDAQKLAADQAYREQQMTLAQQEFAYNQNRDSVQDAQTAAKNTANQGWSVLELGVMPSAEQLSAMGMSTAQAQQYLTEAKALADATAQAQRIGDNSKVAALGWTSLEAGIVPSAEQLAAMGVSAADAKAYIERNRQTGAVIGSTGSQQSGGTGSLQSGGSTATSSSSANKTADAEQIYQDALRQYQTNGAVPSLTSLVNRGLTTSEAQSVLDRLKPPVVASKPQTTGSSTGSSTRTDTKGNVMQAVNADQILADTQSNKPISPNTQTSATNKTADAEQIYQNALRQYQVNGSLPSLTSLVNRGLTTSEAQSVLDRLKTPTSSSAAQAPVRTSAGVTDPTTGAFITSASPNVKSIRTDSNGNTVYTLTDGRVLTDYTSRGASTTAPTGSQTTAPGGRTGSTNAVNADQLNALNNLLKKLY